jgi:hypothetical protein
VEAGGEHGPSTVDADQRELALGVLLDDLVCDAHERAPHVVAAEDELLGLHLNLPGLAGPG